MRLAPLVVGVMLALFVAMPAWALSGALQIQSPVTELVPGTQVDFDIRATSTSQISTLQFTLDYDSNVLQFSSVTIGADMPTGFQIYAVYTESTFPPTAPGTNRVVVVQINTYIPTAFFTGSNRRVAKLRFVVQPGYCRTSPLAFDGLCNRTQLVTQQFETICAANLQLQNGSATQRCVSDAPPPVAALVRLHPNAPNPFNPTTQIAFDLAVDSDVRLAVWSADGRRVKILESGRLTAGPHRATWDGRDDRGAAMASGVYWCRLEVPQGQLSRAMVLVR